MHSNILLEILSKNFDCYIFVSTKFSMHFKYFNSIKHNDSLSKDFSISSTSNKIQRGYSNTVGVTQLFCKRKHIELSCVHCLLYGNFITALELNVKAFCIVHTILLLKFTNFGVMWLFNHNFR